MWMGWDSMWHFHCPLVFISLELILNLDHKLHSQFFRPDPYLLLKLNLFHVQPLWKSVQRFPKIKTKKIKESNQATQPCTRRALHPLQRWAHLCLLLLYNHSSKEPEVAVHLWMNRMWQWGNITLGLYAAVRESDADMTLG